jgi:hypothetical protein
MRSFDLFAGVDGLALARAFLPVIIIADLRPALE